MTVLDKTCKIHSACYPLRSTSGDWPVLWQIGIMLGLICNALALHGGAGVPILLVISMENDKSSLGRVGHFAFNWRAKSKYQLQEMLVNINPFNFFREKYSFYTYRYYIQFNTCLVCFVPGWSIPWCSSQYFRSIHLLSTWCRICKLFTITFTSKCTCLMGRVMEVLVFKLIDKKENRNQTETFGVVVTLVVKIGKGKMYMYLYT